jgi:large subunit ribosomal protein L5
MQSHQLAKIVVSVGVGKMRQSNAQFDDKILPGLLDELALIVGQKPAPRKAKKSIAAFKSREGDIIGAMVTLRGKRMQDFFNRFVNISLPRVRDFRGIDTKNFDDRGNLTIGVKEHTVFPEINPEVSRANFGVEVTFVAGTKTKEEGMEFFKKLGIPLKK